MPARADCLAFAVVAALPFALAACAAGPLVLSPLPALPPACPVQGCDTPALWVRAGAAPLALCAASSDAVCGGASAEQCTDRALRAWGEAWGEAHDGRARGCVARMLAEACSQGDPRACAFAGRLWLDGNGVTRDVDKGLALLTEACDGGIIVGCAAGAQWLANKVNEPGAQPDEEVPALRARLELEQSCLTGQAEACYQVGQSFEAGLEGFPRDLARAARAYGRGCDLEDARACNSYGCALEYGDGLTRDSARATASFARSCHLGESTGCANVGYMAEHGEGIPRDLGLARALYRDACKAGEFYGCLHAEMLAEEDAGAPRDLAGALARWEPGCTAARSARSARACEFTSILYLDGVDGQGRDPAKSLRAMSRACDWGDRRACAWVKSYSEE